MSTTDEILHRIEALERENQELRDQIHNQNNNEQLVGRRGILASLGLLLLPAAAAQHASADQAAEYACVWLGNQDANGFQLDDLDEINFSDGTTLGSASAVGTGALSDSGTDNPDGGDQYVLPQAEDSIDLQSAGDIQNAASIDTDQLSIGQAVAKVHGTTNTSISNTSTTTVDLDTIEKEDTDVVDVTLANNDIDVLVSADYFVVGRTRWASDNNWTTGDQKTMNIRVNGSNEEVNISRKVGTGLESVAIWAYIPNMSVNDTITFNVFQDSGSTISLDQANDSSEFAVYKAT